MKKLCVYLCGAVLAALAATPCHASDSPWNGTWKINQAKSKTTGDTFTVSEGAGGKYHFSNGGTIEYDYACDGKEYTTLADRTVSCTGSPAAGMDYTYKAGQTVIGTEHQALSADGKMLVSTSKSTRLDGSSGSDEATYQRVEGTSGVVGKWKSVKDKSSGDYAMTINVSDGTMHVQVPAWKQMYDAKLDGTPAPVTGPTIPAGATTAVNELSATKVHYANMLNGKTLWEGTQALSADGKTLTDEEWVPGKMDEKIVTVFDKQ